MSSSRSLSAALVAFALLAVALVVQVGARRDVERRYRAVADTANRQQREIDELQARFATTAANSPDPADLDAARRAAFGAHLRAAAYAIDAGDLVSATTHLEAAPEELRDWAWGRVQLRVERLVAELDSFDELVFDLALSRDGTHATIAAGDRTVNLYSVADGGELIATRADFASEVSCVDLSSDGTTVAVGTESGAVLLLDRELETKLTLTAHDARVQDIAFDGSGTRLASASRDGSVAVFDLSGAGEIAHTLRQHEGEVLAVAISDDGSTVISGGDDDQILAWSVERETVEDRLTGLGGRLIGLHASAAADVVAFSTDLGRTSTWRPSFGDPGAARRDLGGERAGCSFDEQGSLLFVARGDESLDVHSTRDLERVASLRWNHGAIDLVASDAQGRRILLSAYDGSVYVWNRDAEAADRAFASDRRWTRALAVGEYGETVVTGGGDGVIRVQDAIAGDVTYELRGHDRGVTALARHGDRLLSGDAGGGARVWNLETGLVERELRDLPQSISAVGFTARGERAILSYRDGAVRVFDVATGELERSSPPVPYLVFALDSDLRDDAIAWAGAGGNFRAWDARSGEKIAGGRFDSTARVSAVTYHRAQDLAALSFSDGRTEVWRGRGFARLASAPAEAESASCLAFTPSGERLAGGFPDGTIRVWDARTGTLLLELAGPGSEYVSILSFSAEGGRLFAGRRGTTHLYESQP